MARHYHINNGGTNLTSNTSAGATTSPVNAVPSITVPFYAVFDATNINGKYEEVEITGKTATNLNHAATTYAHTTAEEVRFPFVATEADEFSAKLNGATVIPGYAGADGWTSVSDTWTYASATTITVPTGAASLYQVGDKIKITQTTAKYFYIVAVADTLLTVTAGSDYTVANAAITSPYYSHVENPVGFPGNFNFAPTRAVSAGTVPTYTAIDISYFNIKGNILFGVISWVNLAGGTAGAGGNNLTFSLPVACKAADFSGDRSHLGFGNSFESAGTIASVGVVGASSASTAELITSSAGAAIKGDDQSSTNRYINASLQYRIA